ncbi:type II toxin-antitoxin system HigB family toxin [Sphingomonas sp. CFBP 13728]|uniref:type II toxin-antitoxin system HigB family toxin n=1 Tax=Sphingomonas sp. CFBP 13728 TaxID=2775294 RepID=UPI00177DC95C|nr:type II toxin-antitoxin system HigB family toxin [Sphingomonas sp. CFBP 13728]MBD8621126.1 type II toxin-antitoxin system HigB family toxin [Sphingomonas sp. CFBP 13728]
MRIIARNRLIAFWARHPTTEASLRHWYEVASAASWKSPLDVVADFSKAKSLDGGRVRFEVAGGDYRMVVAFDWRRSIAFIKFAGTHADYDKIDALTVSLF